VSCEIPFVTIYSRGWMNRKEMGLEKEINRPQAHCGLGYVVGLEG